MSETTALATADQGALVTVQPGQIDRARAIDDLLNKVALVQEVMKKVMKEGEHFGKIPGCGDKPGLFKSGAEKLAMVFKLKTKPHLEIIDLGNGHREYRTMMELSDGTTTVGSCSTMENKYRWRQGERRCPNCGSATLLKSKKPGEGWFCWQKKGGCGAQFELGDKSVEGQQVGKVEHDNPADFYNTCLQMSNKRAFVQAVRTATACSDIFIEAPDDEDPDGDSQPKTRNKPAAEKVTKPDNFVGEVTAVGGQSGNESKPRWLLTFTTNDTVVKAWTHDKAAVALAQQLLDTKELARVSIAPAGESHVVTSIARADEPV